MSWIVRSCPAVRSAFLDGSCRRLGRHREEAMTPAPASAVAAYVQAMPGLKLRDGGAFVARVGPALMARLERHKAAVIELLAGNLCRYCGDGIDYGRPGCLVFSDGSGAHLGCYERAETERQATRRAADDRR
jgi:hypothetical protein